MVKSCYIGLMRDRWFLIELFPKKTTHPSQYNDDIGERGETQVDLPQIEIRSQVE